MHSYLQVILVVGPAHVAVQVLGFGFWDQLRKINGYHLSFFVVALFDAQLVF